MEARNDDERADRVGQIVEEDTHPVVGIRRAVDREENHGNFKKRGGLAEETWRERPVPLNNQNDRGHDK